MKKANVIAVIAAVGAIFASGCSMFKNEDEKPLKILRGEVLQGAV